MSECKRTGVAGDAVKVTGPLKECSEKPLNAQENEYYCRVDNVNLICRGDSGNGFHNTAYVSGFNRPSSGNRFYVVKDMTQGVAPTDLPPDSRLLTFNPKWTKSEIRELSEREREMKKSGGWVGSHFEVERSLRCPTCGFTVSADIDDVCERVRIIADRLSAIRVADWPDDLDPNLSPWSPFPNAHNGSEGIFQISLRFLDQLLKVKPSVLERVEPKELMGAHVPREFEDARKVMMWAFREWLSARSATPQPE